MRVRGREVEQREGGSQFEFGFEVRGGQFEFGFAQPPIAPLELGFSSGSTNLKNKIWNVDLNQPATNKPETGHSTLYIFALRDRHLSCHAGAVSGDVAACQYRPDQAHSRCRTFHYSTLKISHSPSTLCAAHFTLHAPQLALTSPIRTLQSTVYSPHTAHFIPYNLDSTLYTRHISALYTLHLPLCTSTSKPHTLHLHSRLRTPHLTFYIMSHSTLHTLHSSLPTPHFALPRAPHSTPYSTFYTLHSTLYIALHNPHSTLHALQPTTHNSHPPPYTLDTATLHTPHFTLRVFLSTPRATPTHLTLYTLQSTCHTSQATLYTPHSTLYTLHSALHTSHFTLYTPPFTLYTLYTSASTLHIAHSAPTLHTLHVTLLTPHFTLHFLIPTLHSTLHTLHFPLPTLRSPLHTLHSAHFRPTHSPLSTLPLHTALYTLHFALHTSRYTLHTPL